MKSNTNIRRLLKTSRHVLLGLFILVVFFGSSGVATAAPAPTPKSNYMFRPGKLIDGLRTGFLHLMYNLEDANFTEGNVQYMTIDYDGEYSGSYVRNGEYGFQSSLANFKVELDKLGIELYEFNGTMTSWITWGFDEIWNTTEFQNDPDFNQETFNNSFLVFANLIVGYLSWETGTESPERFELFYCNTIRRRFAIFHVARYLDAEHDLNLWAFYDLFTRELSLLERKDFVTLITIAINYFDQLSTDVDDHTELDISKTYDINISKTVRVIDKGVIILYDGDKSLINGFEDFRQNKTVSTNPFTGDEILTAVHKIFIDEAISGYWNTTTLWSYEDGSPAWILRDYIARLTKYRLVALSLARRMRIPLSQLMMFMGSEREFIATGEIARHTYRGGFSVSELAIQNVSFVRKDGNLVLEKLKFGYREHHSLGTIIYNDTNGNGIMDVGVRKDPTTGLIYPTKTEESLYRVDWTGVESKTFHKPKTTNDVMSFGVDYTNVHAKLVPFETSADQALFNDSYTVVPETIDEVSLMFHYTPDLDNKRIDLKFDYYYGDWSNTSVLEGLGLNQAFISTFINSDAERKIDTVTDDNGDNFDPDAENSTRMRKFQMKVGNTVDSEISLDEIPYSWNGGESNETAYGQAMPLRFTTLTYGSVSSTGDLVETISAHTSRKVFLYSISYPKFDGKSIYHDPIYTTIVPTTSYNPEDTTGNPSGILSRLFWPDLSRGGFVLVSVLGAIAAIGILVLFQRKRI